MDVRTLLITILSQVPLATVVLTWREYAMAHFGRTAAVAIAYEFAVVVLAFGKKVWAKIEDKLVQSTVDWLVNAANSVAPNFRRRYYRHVVREHGVFTVSGLGLIQTYRFRLEQVFVDLRIQSGNPARFNVDPIRQKDVAGSAPIWAFLQKTDSDKQEAKTLAIIGPPGSGKTTLLKHLAISLATSRDLRHEIAAIPILLYLRDHIQAITQDRLSLGNLAHAYFGNTNAFATLKPPANWFQRQLERGRCLVMLDGLDEVAELQQRKSVSEWVDRQIRNYPDCRFVLTARPQGYLDAPLELADMVLEVQPFNAEQVKRFVENWYLANEVMSSKGEADSAVRERASAGANNLLQRLRDVPSLSALTINPLLLTMIAMVHRYRGALPGSRVELYAEICEVLLERWRQTRNIPDTLRLKASQKLVVLRSLAAHMMDHRIRDISTEEAIAKISGPLERVGATAIDGRTFLKDLQASSGLLLERETNHWSFAHLTFQEYLTSVHWLDGNSPSSEWQPLVGDSWWHETLRLYAAQTNSTMLVKACLADNTIAALTLAADFLDESRELDPAIRREVEEILIAGLVSTDSARRRLAAEVQLSRRIRSHQRIDERRAIDSTHISCAEYQLFLDSMQNQDRYFQPPHWENLSFQSDEALKPIAGIEPQDATAFCGWLTQRHGGTAHYRLPDFNEAGSHPAVSGMLGTWCKQNGQYNLIGVEQKKWSTIVTQLKKLSTLPVPSSSAVHPVLASKDVANLQRELQSTIVSSNEHLKSIDISSSNSHQHLSNANQLSRFLQKLVSNDFLTGLFCARDLAVDLVLNLDSSLGIDAFNSLSDANRRLLERMEKRAIARSSSLAADLRQVHEIIGYRDLDLAFAVNLGKDVISDLDSGREIIEDMEFALGKQLRSELVVTLAMELVRVLILNLALCRIIQAIDNHDQPRVQQIARYMIPSSDQSIAHNYQPISGLRTAVWRPDAKVRLELRQAWAETLEYAYLSYQELTREPLALNWRRWRRAKGDSHNAESRQKRVLDYCWWLKIINARQEGLIPCWEGIRTIREEIELTPSAR